MTVKELIENLKQYPENMEVITGVNNHFTDTYGIVDHTLSFNPYNDLFGTPGKTDKRLPDNDCVYLASEFPWKYGVGNEDINTPIWEVNGPQGDPDLIWKINNFEYKEKINAWEKIVDNQKSIHYLPEIKELTITNWTIGRKIIITNPGIADLRNAIKLCGLDVSIMI